MKNNLIKTVILLFAVMFVTLQSCDKKTIVPEDETFNNKNNVITFDFKHNDNVYLCNGKKVNPQTIDWNKDGLNVFYGFDNTKNIYVFNTEKEMLDWVKNTNRAKEVTKVLNNIKTAREFAEKIGEFDKEQTSPEFEKYLKENFSAETSGKGLGLFYHNQYYGGNNFGISSFPKGKLKSANDDKTSSLKYFGNTMRMSSKKYWKGTQRWIWTPTFIFVPYLGDFDNELSSYWNW